MSYFSYMKIIPKIPIVYKGKFPKNFTNDVHGWGSFSKEVLEKKQRIN